MRTICMTSGLRYFKRMDIYMLVYVLLVTLNYIYVIAYMFDYVPPPIQIPLPALFSVQMYFANAVTKVLSLLDSAAYLNDETSSQIVKFNYIRGMLHEISEFKEIYLEYFFPEDNGDALDIKEPSVRSNETMNTSNISGINLKKTDLNTD